MLSRRLLQLNGISILAVVLNHAAGWGFTAMFWWAHRYRPVTSPNFDELGSLPYYALVLLKQLTVFCVPAFLFTSGFFVAYAARGTQLNWKVIRTRLGSIVIPYLIWSVVVFAVEWVQKVTYSPWEYVQQLVLGGATPIYWYIPVICQFYVLAPLLIPFAKSRWKLLLALAAVLQAAMMLYNYFNVLIWKSGPDLSWFFGNYALFFSIGVASGFHLEAIRRRLLPIKWPLLMSMLLAAVFTTVEGEVISRATGADFRGGSSTFGGTLYSVSLISCFLAFDQAVLPNWKLIDLVSRRLLGIYLIHPVMLIIAAKLAYHFIPQILAYQTVFQPFLIITAVGGSLSIMEIASRWPTWRYYKFVFG